VRALDELPDDATIGLNHWPVQVSAGIAVMLASVVAASVPGHRTFPIAAASLTAGEHRGVHGRQPRCRHRHRERSVG
jgi:hypothetical protein